MKTFIAPRHVIMPQNQKGKFARLPRAVARFGANSLFSPIETPIILMKFDIGLASSYR